MAKQSGTQTGNNSGSGAYVSLDNLLRLRHHAKDHRLETRKKSTAITDGISKTHFRGRGMEFSEVRPYQAGDDVRNIDWRVTARTMQPYTKLFQEERERPVYLVVDQRSPMFFGTQRVFKSVAAAEMATLIGWIAQTNNDRIGGLLFGDDDQFDLRARRGKHAILGLIHNLHQYNTRLTSPVASSRIHLQDICTELRRIARPGSAIFILSDFHDVNDKCEEALTMLSRHTDISLFKFSDPLERELPPNRELTLSNSRERLTIQLQDGNFLTDFRNNYTRINNHLQHFTGVIGARLINVDCSADTASQAHHIFTSSRARSGRRQ